MFQLVTLPDAALRRILSQLDEQDLMNVWTAYKVELRNSYDMRNNPVMRKKYDDMTNTRKRKTPQFSSEKISSKKRKSSFSINDLVSHTF